MTDDWQVRGPKPSDGLFIAAVTGDDPAQVLEDIVAELRRCSTADNDFVEMMGIGPLEALLHGGHGDALWPRIEHLARHDLLFRRALRAVWAYDSPEFERRERLLTELDADGRGADS